MARHKPTVIWMLRRAGRYPNGCVKTESENELSVTYQANELQFESGFICSRKDAKLFVRRILQCLQETA